MSDVPNPEEGDGRRGWVPPERRVLERLKSNRPGNAVIRVRRRKLEGFSRTAEGPKGTSRRCPNSRIRMDRSVRCGSCWWGDHFATRPSSTND
jgi:hypothetical protein